LLFFLQQNPDAKLLRRRLFSVYDNLDVFRLQRFRETPDNPAWSIQRLTPER
jgi:hypothetical protein